MTVLQVKAAVLRKEQLSNKIVRLTFHAPEIASHACPGQFLMVKATDQLEPLLRRPFSIHQTTAEGSVQILFRVVGKGSEFLSERQNGDVLDLIGPLGHGFTLPAKSGTNICFVGGGMGCAPLYFLVKRFIRDSRHAKLQIYLGAATAEELLAVRDDFENLGVSVHVATDDGTLGYHGYVTDLLAASLNNEDKWQVYTCGPQPMMKKLVDYCATNKWSCQVSLETMMACGISACLGCAVPASQAKAASSQKQFLHVCKDGPVFDYGDIEWTI